MSLRNLLVAAVVLNACSNRTAGHRMTDGTLPAPIEANWVVDQFFVKPSFPERAAYVTGEVAQDAALPTFGATRLAGDTVRARLIAAEPALVLFAIEHRMSGHLGDFYAFLERENGRWKLSAVRSLVVPEFALSLARSVDVDTVKDPDLRRLVSSLSMVESSDAQLKSYFASNRRELDVIADVARQISPLPEGQGDVSGEIAHSDSLTPLLRAVGVLRLYRSQDFPGCLFLTLGGFLDNEVGFLFAPKGCRAPRPSPNEFIYIEKLAGTWLLYKTT